MIIDAHVNITEDGKWFNTNYDASLERLLSEMNEAQIDKCLLISMPYATTNKYIASVIEKYPNVFKGLAHIDFSLDINTQINEIIKMGFSGVKVHPRIQNISISKKKYEYLWKLLNDMEIPLVTCGYLQVPNDNLYISDLEPTSYEYFIKKYKKLNFVLSHFGSHKIFDTYFLCRANPNFFTNLSYTVNIFQGTSIFNDLRYVVINADKKIIFGSDFPEFSLKESLLVTQKLLNGIDKNKKENILYNNAYKLFWRK